MSSSKHAIIGSATTSVFTLLLTYFASVNFFCDDVNVSWLPNDFLVAIFGGVFASALVVMLCEIQKYEMSKSSAEYALYCNATILFSQVVTMRSILNRCFKYPEEKLTRSALNYCAQKASVLTQNIVNCDYNPFLTKRSKSLDALCSFRAKERLISDILIECCCYYDMAYNTSVILHIQNNEAPDVFGKDDFMQGISKALRSRLGTLKYICDELLRGIDYKGKFQWNAKKKTIDFEYIDSIRALNLEEYIEKYCKFE